MFSAEETAAANNMGDRSQITLCNIECLRAAKLPKDNEIYFSKTVSDDFDEGATVLDLRKYGKPTSIAEKNAE